jgi:hypothetical protein
LQKFAAGQRTLRRCAAKGVGHDEEPEGELRARRVLTQIAKGFEHALAIFLTEAFGNAVNSRL